MARPLPPGAWPQGWAVTPRGRASPLPPACPSRGLLPARGPLNPSAEPAAESPAPAEAAALAGRQLCSPAAPTLALPRSWRILLFAASACSGCCAQAISARVWPVRMLLLAASGPDNVCVGLMAKTISFFSFHFKKLCLFRLSSQAAGEGKPGLSSCLPGASPWF